MSCENMAGDNRFETIAKAKQAILDGTNIETDEDEMKVLDNILFRCWQMGWLDKYDDTKNQTRWTPCSERLPKENGHYLVTFHQTATEEDLGFDMDDTDVRKMRYDTKHGWRTPRRIPSWINDAVVSTVLAWMPLPEAWKGEHDG